MIWKTGHGVLEEGEATLSLVDVLFRARTDGTLMRCDGKPSYEIQTAVICKMYEPISILYAICSMNSGAQDNVEMQNEWKSRSRCLQWNRRANLDAAKPNTLVLNQFTTNSAIVTTMSAAITFNLVPFRTCVCGEKFQVHDAADCIHTSIEIVALETKVRYSSNGNVRMLENGVARRTKGTRALTEFRETCEGYRNSANKSIVRQIECLQLADKSKLAR